MSSNTDKSSPRKLSILSEFSAISFVMIGILVIGMILSIVIYILMVVPPAKVYKLEDDADLFSDDEEDEIRTLARNISRGKDINVIIVTTADKGESYGGYSESESIRYAQDQFKELTKFEPFRDNSGVLILTEIEGDYRFFYIVTFGTARASIIDTECDEIFYRHKSLLQSGDYAAAVQGSLEEIKNHNFTSGLLIFTYASFVFGPIAIVAFVLWIMARRKRSKITVDHKTYYDAKHSEIIGDEDIYQRETVSVTYNSSGSSGGFSSGRSGGGFSGGGGGGGGGFGGGGGRF